MIDSICGGLPQHQPTRRFPPLLYFVVPMRWTGLSGANTPVALHLIMVIIVAILFSNFTTSSLLGHSWQAVSQPFSENTFLLIQKAYSMKDKEAENWAQSNALDLDSYGLYVIRQLHNDWIDLGAKGVEMNRADNGSFYRGIKHITSS